MRRDGDVVARDLTRGLARDGSPTAWFDEIYRQADAGATDVPWGRSGPHPMLVDWLGERRLDGLRGVVPGVGTGWDAEFLASRGADVAAFDVSSVAVDAVQRAHPGSSVAYVTADLLDLSPGWSGAFDLVVEAMTVQSMPRRVRTDAIAAIRRLVAPGGTLLVIGLSLPDGADLADGPPWCLTDDELRTFAEDGLALTRVLHADRLYLHEVRRS